MFRLGVRVLLLLGLSSAELSSSVRPVIGILSMPPSAAEDSINYSRIDSSYVRWLQGAGALITPILFNDTAANIESQFFKLSGILFTGGPSKPTDFNRYFRTATQIYKLSVEYGLPLWGTCLGFQTISDIIAGGVDILSDYDATEMELPLKFTKYASSSRMFGTASSDIMSLFSDHSYTTNWHHYGVSLRTFEKVLAGEMMAVSVNLDENNLPFISTMEHVSAPIYAVQWHPEANAHDREHEIVDHSLDAVRAMQYLSNFFVNEARTKGLGPGDVGMSASNRFLVDIDVFPMRFIEGSHSLKYEFM